MLVLQDEENSRNWLHNYANIFHTIELYSLKKIKMGNFMLSVFCDNEKKNLNTKNTKKNLNLINTRFKHTK